RILDAVSRSLGCAMIAVAATSACAQVYLPTSIRRTTFDGGAVRVERIAVGPDGIGIGIRYRRPPWLRIRRARLALAEHPPCTGTVVGRPETDELRLPPDYVQGLRVRANEAQAQHLFE